ncbi:RCC1 domain-containing protein [Candidatus Nitrotoga sp. M5]|uniref:RCC1 domain-containing protein n=1 Tax=Candidatus Nitrotoga sp. M5 TaxID=2890409 RepID=UPI001EF4040B|nr:hypothetical protein [Candidatus Nitrotoga sp. M5]
MSHLLKRIFCTLPLVFIGCLGSMPGHAAETSVVAISAGDDYTCALTSAGGVKCWGYNDRGQLGNNSTTNSSIPVDVTGLSSGVAAISAGATYTCALTSAGGVKCWGHDTLIPKDMPGLTSGVAAIDSTYGRTCVLTTIGGVKCFNGIGMSYGASLANQPGLPSDVTAIATGQIHNCALTASGGVKCWGYNQSGQLGDNSYTSSNTPVNVSGLSSGVSAISVGILGSSFALTTAGGVKFWGNSGILGSDLGVSDLLPSSSTPLDIVGLTSGIAAIDTSGFHFCALTMVGGVKCFGHNDYGQLGNNSDSGSLTPVDVSGLISGMSAISTGSSHTCAITSAGRVKCWGSNEYGQLGDGSKRDRWIPVDVVGLDGGVIPDPVLPPNPVVPASSAVAISAGFDHTCALTTAGGVKCWGGNEYGQLGNNSTTDSSVPVDVTGLTSGVAAISAGGIHTCALTSAGGVKCWGMYGSLIPIDIPGLASGVVAIDSSIGGVCVLTTIGGVKCFIDLGKEGISILADQLGIPADLPGVLGKLPDLLADLPGQSSGVTAIAAGFYYTCALTAAGGVSCQNWDFDIEVGPNIIRDKEPVNLPGLSSGVAAISAGLSQICALTRAGGVKCWAYYGVHGNNSPTDSNLIAVDVAGLASGIAAVDTGGPHICVLTTAGGVKCWGSNEFGQLGDNTVSDDNNSDDSFRLVVDVSGLTSGVSAISTGFFHTCALTTAGGVKCWGLNRYGQLGDNSTTDRLTPVNVVGFGGGVFPDPILPPSPVESTSPLTGLWWNQNESGWGMSITQRDAMAFLAWYTYDSIGQPTWFVISSCPLVGSGCTGDIYSVVGGTPLGVAWNGNGKVVTKVGTGTFAYSDNNTGTLNYSINDVNGTKQITRQMFAAGAVQPPVDYSALWWNENESGWGLAITQQYGMIFATMYTYDASGNPVWYVASSCPLTGNSCAGDLYQVTGGSAPTKTWNDAAKVVTKVGTVNFVFQNSSAGTLTYTINGVSGSKAISRQLF